MSDARDIMIEQLQYVQFFEGGRSWIEFRKASPTFSGSDELIEFLSYYARYMLPPGSGPLASVSSSEAPKSLALVRTEHNGSILVQKVYGSVQGPPHVNIRMLVGLPLEFSLKEAITLWESMVWTRNLEESLSFEFLRVSYIKVFLVGLPFLRILPSRKEREEARVHLPFVLQSYLLQQAIREHLEKGQRFPRILLIAPATQVAYFISVLSHLLPQQLLRDVTFNTYEHDIVNQPYHICGTCPLPRQNGDVSLLDLTSYETDFVLDIYTQGMWQPEFSGFDPDLFNTICRYADFAAEALKPDYIDPKLREFLEKFEEPEGREEEEREELTVATFLEQYQSAFEGSGPALHPGSQIQQDHLPNDKDGEPGATDPRIEAVKKTDRARGKNESSNRTKEPSHKQVAKDENTLWEPTQTLSHDIKHENTVPHGTNDVSGRDIEKALTSTKEIEKWLCGRDESDRQRMIEMILADTAWLQNAQPQYWEHMQKAIGKHPEKIHSVRNILIQKMRVRAIMAVRAGDENRFQVVLLVLSDISPPTSGASLWYDLLEELVAEEQSNGFIQHPWFAGERLLTIARHVLQPGIERDNRLMVSLLKVEPSDFGRLLTLLLQRTSASGETDQLRFPSEWISLATQLFTEISPGQLTPNSMHYFEQHHAIVGMLLKQIGDLEGNWQLLARFLEKLKKSGYQRELLFQCFETRLSLQGAEFLAMRFDEKGQEELFKRYEALCIGFFPTSALFRAITQRYLPTFPLTWDRINTLKLMLEKLEGTEINTLVTDIAEVLDACIDSPIRLGMLFSPLVQLKAGAHRLLRAMAQHARDEFMRVTTSKEHGGMTAREVSRVKSRFSAYVQFALCVDATYDRKEEFGVNLLNHLLHGADESVFVFINKEAQNWPADLRKKWEGEVMAKRRHPSQVGSAPVTPSPPRRPVPKEVQPSAEQAEILAGEELRVRERLDKLAKQKNARKLAAFWLENYVVLTLIHRQPIGQDKWDQMQIAYDFCDACKKADNAKKGSKESIEAEQAIVDACGKSQRSRRDLDLLRFTRTENKRIGLALERIKPAGKRPQTTSGDNQ